MKYIRAERREKKRSKAQRRMTTLSDQRKRRMPLKSAAAIHVVKKSKT